MSEPIRDELYPDLAAGGGLAAAMQRLAADSGLHLGSITESTTPEFPGVRIILADREVAITLESGQREFTADFWSENGGYAHGATADLHTLAAAIHDWGQGLSLFELPSRHPFMKVSEVAMAHERGEAAEFRWQSLLEDNEYQHPGVHVIAQAAAAEPRLRELYPYTSHHVLCFSRCTVYPYSMDLPYVVPMAGGRYRALRRDGSILLDTSSAAEAAAAVVAALPDDCGPAISGTLGR